MFDLVQFMHLCSLIEDKSKRTIFVAGDDKCADFLLAAIDTSKGISPHSAFVHIDTVGVGLWLTDIERVVLIRVLSGHSSLKQLEAMYSSGPVQFVSIP